MAFELSESCCSATRICSFNDVQNHFLEFKMSRNCMRAKSWFISRYEPNVSDSPNNKTKQKKTELERIDRQKENERQFMWKGLKIKAVIAKKKKIEWNMFTSNRQQIIWNYQEHK